MLEHLQQRHREEELKLQTAGRHWKMKTAWKAKKRVILYIQKYNEKDVELDTKENL